MFTSWNPTTQKIDLDTIYTILLFYTAVGFVLVSLFFLSLHIHTAVIPYLHRGQFYGSLCSRSKSHSQHTSILTCMYKCINFKCSFVRIPASSSSFLMRSSYSFHLGSFAFLPALRIVYLTCLSLYFMRDITVFIPFVLPHMIRIFNKLWNATRFPEKKRFLRTNLFPKIRFSSFVSWKKIFNSKLFEKNTSYFSSVTFHSTIYFLRELNLEIFIPLTVSRESNLIYSLVIKLPKKYRISFEWIYWWRMCRMNKFHG